MDSLLESSNKQPNIVAVGLSAKEIIHYYIDLEKDLIDVRFH